MELHWRERRTAGRKQRPFARGQQAVSRGYRRMLVPVADNPASEQAMDVACRLAAEHQASITAVTVIEIPPLLPLDAHMIEEEDEARRLLERAAAIGDSFGVGFSSRILRSREAAGAIVDQAKATRPDIVVMGGARKSRRSAHAPIFGSTVQVVLRKAPCRVMVVAASAENGAVAEQRQTVDS